jgi:hypothetical protein
LHATSLRATLMMVPHRATWLRLLVTALLCVVGVGRPLAQRSEADAAVQANGPNHVSASTREGELVTLRKRVADPSNDDKASLVEAPPDRVAADRGRVDVGVWCDARRSSVSAERPRARGPPIV